MDNTVAILLSERDSEVVQTAGAGLVESSRVVADEQSRAAPELEVNRGNAGPFSFGQPTLRAGLTSCAPDTDLLDDPAHKQLLDPYSQSPLTQLLSVRPHRSRVATAFPPPVAHCHPFTDSVLRRSERQSSFESHRQALSHSSPAARCRTQHPLRQRVGRPTSVSCIYPGFLINNIRVPSHLARRAHVLVLDAVLTFRDACVRQRNPSQPLSRPSSAVRTCTPPISAPGSYRRPRTPN